MRLPTSGTFAQYFSISFQQMSAATGIETRQSRDFPTFRLD